MIILIQLLTKKLNDINLKGQWSFQQYYFTKDYGKNNFSLTIKSKIPFFQ